MWDTKASQLCRAMPESQCIAPGIDADIEDFINSFSSCLINWPNQPHETMTPSYKLPDGPWQKVGVDFFKHNGQKYMAVIDYFSKFSYLCPVRNTNAKHTINHLSDILSIENAHQQFWCQTMDHLSTAVSLQSLHKYGILNTYQLLQTMHWINGQIECTIQTLKQMLSMWCATAKQDWNQAVTSAQSNTYCQWHIQS